MIPSRIITTYHSAHAFLPTFARCYAQMRKLHPRWSHRFFNDVECRAFIAKRRPDLLELYDFYPRPVQRADFFRVVAVHELGGFYLDLDMHLHTSLDPLRKASLVLTEEWQMSEDEFRERYRRDPRDSRELFQVGNYAFAARRRHWFLEEVIEEMIVRAEAINPSTTFQGDVLFSTGPDVFSTVYTRHRVRLAEEAILLRGDENAPEPRTTFAGEPWRFQFGRYGNHLMTSVWRK